MIVGFGFSAAIRCIISIVQIPLSRILVNLFIKINPTTMFQIEVDTVCDDTIYIPDSVAVCRCLLKPLEWSEETEEVDMWMMKWFLPLPGPEKRS